MLDGDGEFTTVVTATLQRAVAADRIDNAARRDGEVRDAIRLLCDRGKLGNLRAEQLIVRVKEVWSALPEARRVGDGPSRDEFLAHVITLCIHEFYSAPGPTR